MSEPAALTLPSSYADPLLLHGDAIDMLARLPDASIDCAIEDPPAGIGFMGKPWDSFKRYEGRSERGQHVKAGLLALGVEAWAAGFVAFMVEAHVAKLRVLKPGAYVVSWALPKTADLQAMALRLAGYDVKDSLLHLFGCLTLDAEILTDRGWVHGQNIGEDDLALCYDPVDGSYRWDRIQRRIAFEYAGPAFRVVGTGVDHVVTPDHRCVDGSRFITAAEAAQESQIHVPVPEGLRDLRFHLACDEQDPGTPREIVQPAMRYGTDPTRQEHGTHDAPSALQDLRRALLAAEPSSELPLLLTPLLRSMASDGSEHPRPVEGAIKQGPCGVDRVQRGELPGENVGPEQPSMEGRRSCPQQADAQGSDHALPAGVRSDGAEGWVRLPAPDRGGASDGPVPTTERGCAPHRPQPAEQRAEQSDAVRQQLGPQALRATRLAAATVERVDHYTGIMWCVTVPTGAFVARTAAGPFVTGNSGMPHGLDVSKAIDKMHGAERKVIGIKTYVGGIGPEAYGRAPTTARGFGVAESGEGGDFMAKRALTAPATDDAHRWSGWNTELAPGYEQWILARAPTRMTYARNVLEHGTGALHVDACRVPRGAAEQHAKYGATDYSQGNGVRAERVYEHARVSAPHADGGYPSNVLLSHAADCAEQCAEGCPIRGLDEQSIGTRAMTRAGSGTRGSVAHNTTYGHMDFRGEACTRYDDDGGASRFFSRFRYQAKARDRSIPGTDAVNAHPTHKHPELMRWLVRLVCPKAEQSSDGVPGIVLDSFMGSGTTGVAAAAERVRFVGIERDPVEKDDNDSFGTARARIEYACAAEDPEAYTPKLAAKRAKKTSRRRATEPTQG